MSNVVFCNLTLGTNGYCFTATRDMRMSIFKIRKKNIIQWKYIFYSQVEWLQKKKRQKKQTNK